MVSDVKCNTYIVRKLRQCRIGVQNCSNNNQYGFEFNIQRSKKIQNRPKFVRYIELKKWIMNEIFLTDEPDRPHFKSIRGTVDPNQIQIFQLDMLTRSTTMAWTPQRENKWKSWLLLHLRCSHQVKRRTPTHNTKCN